MFYAAREPLYVTLKIEFQKPRKHIFSRKAYKKVQKAKVFGITTSKGQVLTCSVPSHPTAKDFIKLVDKRLGPFLKAAFPERTWKTILLDGESVFHTDEAKAMMRKWHLKALPSWPPHSPDLNPEEYCFLNVLCMPRGCSPTCDKP